MIGLLVYFANIQGNILPLIVLSNGEFYGVSFIQIIEVVFLKECPVEIQIIGRHADESVSIFQAQDLAFENFAFFILDGIVIAFFFVVVFIGGAVGSSWLALAIDEKAIDHLITLIGIVIDDVEALDYSEKSIHACNHICR